MTEFSTIVSAVIFKITEFFNYFSSLLKTSILIDKIVILFIRQGGEFWMAAIYFCGYNDDVIKQGNTLPNYLANTIKKNIYTTLSTYTQSLKITQKVSFYKLSQKKFI